MAAMVNMTNLLNGKDSRWLQLEVCREFQRNKCSRPDTECKFAHPPANVEVQNGRVTACYDSIKGRCNREKPPCKYFHPPQHLKDQLLINGRNHLALKNALMQQMGIAPGQPGLPGQVPTVDVQNGNTGAVPSLGIQLAMGSQPYMTTNPYLTGMPANTFSPYYTQGHLVPTILGPDPSSVATQMGQHCVQQAVPIAQQKIPRSDRLESTPVSAAAAAAVASSGPLLSAAATLGSFPPPGPAPSTAMIANPHLEAGKKRAADNDMLHMMDMKSVGSIYYENFFPQSYNMVPFKRPAGDKSGIPVYQPGATTYQQLMQLQQPFVPVSCEYPSPSPSATTTIPQTSTANPIANSNNKSHYLVNNSNINNNNNNNSHFNNNNNNKNIMTTTPSTTTPTVVAASTSIQASIHSLLNNNHTNNITSSNNASQIATSNALNPANSGEQQTQQDTMTGSPPINGGGSVTECTNDEDSDGGGGGGGGMVSPTAAAVAAAVQQQQQQLQQRMLLASAVSSPHVATPPSLQYKTTPTSQMVSSQSHSHLIQTPSTVSASHTQTFAAPISSPYITYTQAAQAQAQMQAAAAAASQHQHSLHSAQARYADPAAMAKEVAQQNYANALKLAAASNTLTGKPLTSLSYTNVNMNKPALLPQPPSGMSAAAAHAHHAVAAAAAAVSHPTMSAAGRYPSPQSYAAAAQPSAQQLMQMSQFARQTNANNSLVAAQHQYASFLRPQMPNAAAAAAANQYAAAAAMQQHAANQQYQSFLYHGLPAGYPFASAPGQMPHGMTAAPQTHTITGLPTMAAHPQAQSTPAPPGTAVVLNPYKKMKTS